MKTIKKMCKYILAKMLIIIPSKKYIVFESNSDFCDNSKVLYDYLVENNYAKEYKLYWAVTDTKKYKDKTNYHLILKKIDIKKPIESVKSLFITTKAKYTFFTHLFIGNIYNKKQIRCFLMHGTSLKNLKDVYGTVFCNSTHAIVTSEFTKKIHNETKHGIGKISHILGYPRNDKLFINEKEKTIFKEKLSLSKYKKIIVWTPTFKHNSNKVRNDLKNKTNDLDIIDNDLIEKLNKILKANKTCLVIKLHPAQDLDYIKFIKSSNIFYLTNDELLKLDVDTYSLLAISDALITDFSSIYNDYLLTNKPIGFELSNIEDYKKSIGFSVSNPLDYMPGMIIKKKDDLIDFVNNIIDEKDEYKQKRLEMKELFHKYYDGNSSKRIVDFFKLGSDKNDEI